MILETVVVGANFWNNLYGLEQLEFAAEVLTSEPQHRDLIRVLRFEDRHGHTLLWGHPAYPRTRLLLLGQPPNLRKVVSWVRHDYRMAGPLRTEELEIGSSRILDPPLYPHQLVFAGPERWTGLKRVKASLRPTIESLSFFTNVWGPHLSILSHLCLDLLSAELSVKECDALQQQKDKLDQFVELLSRATSETGLLVFVVYGTDYRYEAHHRHPWRSKATSQRLMQLLESETTWVCSLHACFRETFSRHDFGEGKVLHYHDMEEYLSSADGRKWRASLVSIISCCSFGVCIGLTSGVIFAFCRAATGPRPRVMIRHDLACSRYQLVEAC